MKNASGWNRYMETTYTEDNDEYNKHELSEIMFREVIETTAIKNSLFKIAEYTKSIFISPASFMDIKLFNGS